MQFCIKWKNQKKNIKKFKRKILCKIFTQDFFMFIKNIIKKTLENFIKKIYNKEKGQTLY